MVCGGRGRKRPKWNGGSWRRRGLEKQPLQRLSNPIPDSRSERADDRELEARLFPAANGELCLCDAGGKEGSDGQHDRRDCPVLDIKEEEWQQGYQGADDCRRKDDEADLQGFFLLPFRKVELLEHHGVDPDLLVSRDGA